MLLRLAFGRRWLVTGPRVPGAGLPGHKGCQGAVLVPGQGGNPGQQGPLSEDHGFNSFQVLALLLWPWSHPHVVIVAGLLHDREDGPKGVAGPWDLLAASLVLSYICQQVL